jgi:hypothetical protein
MKKKYHGAVTGKDKVVYDEVVQLLGAGKSVVNIHWNTIYHVKGATIE